MSELIPFVPGQLPAHLRGEVDDVTKALAGKRSGGPRISLRGCVFRMIEGGKEVATNDNRAMNIVIVNCAPVNSRSFYAGTYAEGENKPPTCWSDDGTKPSADCKTPVSTSCATCPKNVKGSGQGDSRACRYLRHLAVMLPNDIHEGRVYKLTLAATSIFGEGKKGALPLESYAAMVANSGTNVSGLVTEMRFDTSVSTPKVTFWPAGYLDAAEYAKVKQLGQSKEALDAIKTTVFEQDFGTNDAAAVKPATVEEVPVKAAAAAGEEPVVVGSTKPVTEVPTSTAAMLNKWDD